MTTADRNTLWLRRLSPLGYVLFLALSLVNALRGDLRDAAALLWIAPIFDPFAVAGRWSERAWWMKAWLYVHVIVALAVTGFAFFVRN